MEAAPDAQALALLAELRAARAARAELRAQNSPERVAAVRAQIQRGELRLKADIKKSSAFVKKLRVLSEASAESVLKDVGELNLTRYVSECVAALTESPLKAADLSATVRVASLLHQLYADFAPALVAALVAAFEASYNSDDRAKMVKRRLILRLLSELYLAAVFDDVHVVAQIVQRVARREQGAGKPRAKGNMSVASSSGGSSSQQLEVPLLVSFAKAVGMEFLGVRSRKFKEMEKHVGDTPEFQAFAEDEPVLVPPSVQTECLSSFLDAFEMICKFYLAQHATLVKIEARNEKEEANRGEVAEQHVQELTQARLLFDKLQTSVNSLADALDRDVPALPLEKKDDDSRGGISLWEGGDASRAELQMDGPFDDEDTRAFYEDLPDLLELVPAVVLGLNEAEVAELKKKRDTKAGEGTVDESGEDADADAEGDVDDEDDDEEEGGSGDIEPAVSTSDAPNAVAADMEVKPEHVDGDGKPAHDASTSGEAVVPTAASAGSTSYHHQLDAFFSSLEDMVNRDRCDKAAVDFCYMNSKASRNRLIKTLFSVPRTHLELLGYYARLVAILQSVLKDDIGNELVKLLVGEFNGLIKRRNQFRLESKIKNIRFLAELVKFRICPPNVGFGCLKKCFADFQGHNVHVATAFLENCGRFLYCSKHTHIRTEKFLNAMMKLKSAKHLDPQLETLVENAYYMCKPPERVERVVKQYDPLYMFTMKLLYKDLNGSNVNKVIKTLRKYPWQEKSTRAMVLKAVLKVTNDKVMVMKWVCEVVKGLSRYHDDFAILLVDDVLEAIRRGLEVNDYRDHQRSLGLIKLLGELFNCGLVTTNVIMETLYLLINQSHDLFTLAQYSNGQIPENQVVEMKKQCQLVSDLRYDPRVPSDVDGPTEVFRIRLVCALIEGCTNGGNATADSRSGSGMGGNSTSGGDRSLSKTRLGRFMTFFQRYMFAKVEIPLETDFVVFDLFDTLSRSLKEHFTKFDTWEDADTAAQIVLATELDEAERRLAKKNHLALAASATNEAAASPGESLSQPADEEEEFLDEDDESEGDDDDDDDDDEEDEDGHREHDGDDDDDDEEDDDDDDEEEDDEEDEEEEQLIIHDRVQKSEEDEAFEKAFKSMMQNSGETRKHATRVNVDKMAIPTVVKATTAPPHAGPAGMLFGSNGAESGVVFRMLRRGNKGKVEARHLVVPEESSLAQHSHRQESVGKKEQNELKRLVLQNMERDELMGSAAEAAPQVFPPPRPSASYTTQEPDMSRAGFGGGSEWNNAEFGLRRGKGYRGVK